MKTSEIILFLGAGVATFFVVGNLFVNIAKRNAIETIDGVVKPF